MNHAGPPPFRQEDIAFTKRLLPETRKKHEAYVARGNWRCEKSPTGAHFAKGENCICEYCGEYRGKR